MVSVRQVKKDRKMWRFFLSLRKGDTNSVRFFVSWSNPPSKAKKKYLRGLKLYETMIIKITGS